MGTSVVGRARSGALVNGAGERSRPPPGRPRSPGERRLDPRPDGRRGRPAGRSGRHISDSRSPARRSIRTASSGRTAHEKCSNRRMDGSQVASTAGPWRWRWPCPSRSGGRRKWAARTRHVSPVSSTCITTTIATRAPASSAASRLSRGIRARTDSREPASTVTGAAVRMVGMGVRPDVQQRSPEGVPDVGAGPALGSGLVRGRDHQGQATFDQDRGQRGELGIQDASPDPAGDRSGAMADRRDGPDWADPVWPERVVHATQPRSAPGERQTPSNQEAGPVAGSGFRYGWRLP